MVDKQLKRLNVIITNASGISAALFAVLFLFGVITFLIPTILTVHHRYVYEYVIVVDTQDRYSDSGDIKQYIKVNSTDIDNWIELPFDEIDIDDKLTLRIPYGLNDNIVRDNLLVIKEGWIPVPFDVEDKSLDAFLSNFGKLPLIIGISGTIISSVIYGLSYGLFIVSLNKEEIENDK